MKGKFERFKNEKIVVNVRSQKQYDEFMKMCEEQGLKWSIGNLATTRNFYYNDYGEETCIDLMGLMGLSYSDIDLYKNVGYKIITYKDFIKEESNQFKKSDLKDNHIIKARHGNKYIWFNYQMKNRLRDDLRDSYWDNDIIEVWEFDKLVWKREEKPVEIQELIKYKNAWEELKEKTLYEEPYDEYYDAGGKTTFEEVFSVFKELELKHGIKEDIYEKLF